MLKERHGNEEPTAKDVRAVKREAIDSGQIQTKATPAKSPKAGLGKIVPMPNPAEGVGGNVGFVTPREFHKKIPDLPSLKELGETIITLKNIDWDDSRKKERQVLLSLLTKWLPLYVQWEQAVLFGNSDQEVA
ncbi:hypothetical protein SDC9_164894 [bioreactor metagenome]|uniref:Uncharacterized protein n=1 Tax=bioreactor metagenome TaxID=1076179 RepID=A0A645FV32_9ZZZZ